MRSSGARDDATIGQSAGIVARDGHDTAIRERKSSNIPKEEDGGEEFVLTVQALSGDAKPSEAASLQSNRIVDPILLTLARLIHHRIK